jgi:hypothetical protein
VFRGQRSSNLASFLEERERSNFEAESTDSSQSGGLGRF